MMEVTEPKRQKIDGEYQRDPWFIRFPAEYQPGMADIAGFDEHHTLTDIARWIVREAREDGEELVRILLELLEDDA